MTEKLRKNQDTLIVIGMGVIAFGFWTVLKTILYTAMPNTVFQPAENLNGILETIIFYLLLVVLVAIDFGLRLYVGRSARAEGFGKKHGWFYLVLTVIMVLINAAITLYEISTVFTGKYSGDMDDAVIACIVDATSTVTLLELVIAGFQVKRLSKVLAEEA